MSTFLSPPVTPAHEARDALLGALISLSRVTINEPKTEDTDRVLAEGLRLAARPDAQEDALRQMFHAVEAEKNHVSPHCVTCTTRCGNADNYDMTRLWNAPEPIRTLKLRLLASLFTLAQGPLSAEKQPAIDEGLFALAEDWEEELLTPVVLRAETAEKG